MKRHVMKRFALICCMVLIFAGGTATARTVWGDPEARYADVQSIECGKDLPH